MKIWASTQDVANRLLDMFVDGVNALPPFAFRVKGGLKAGVEVGMWDFWVEF
jgi:hypothetical protein